ncbi:Zinc finger, NHR/GATA-type [Lasallia pustulata]|uniref:Zinc finger, NHR/GATA-type n=1 Tax=Lasallia pustulata TaxID=136370 RepID=A0A1W5D7Z9_9LECA|nr:Zinc finger, NHR/GATA-type [Lasallia pustulata]
MSSPFTAPNNAYPARAAASSPGPGGRGRGASQAPEDLAIRPMRLKVLYTFDDQNKTNCLARWPQVLDIRTAYLDEITQVGVIELKTCIQAIVSASPELVAKLGQDYTVYAYDYSEYETPLVGQGMLSWVLASSSSTPSAPAHQSRTVVTGRVCKNILGLFSSSVQETLEVKLRLVPVPTCLQSEYIESMRQYRDLSRIMPEGFDAAAWTAFLQANPGITQLAGQSRSQTPADVTSQREGVGIEHVQRLMNRDYAPNRIEDSRSFQRRNSYSSTGSGEQIARIASPAYSVQSAGGLQESLPRTSSRGPYLGVQEQSHDRRTSMGTGSVMNDERFEEGPARKRAKVMKAEWPGKGGFGRQPESLRVAASTAASIRVYQPTAIRPSVNASASLEQPPRAPTPIPASTNQMKRPLLPAAKSNLRRESYSNVAESYISPYATSELISRPPEPAMTSPEKSHTGSNFNSPAHIASSPPELRRGSLTPSSPRLPMWPQDVDSGFMSGTIDDLFEEDDEDRPVDEEDAAIGAQYSKREQSSTTQTTNQNAASETAADHLTVEESQIEAKAATAQARSRTAARNASRVRSLNRTASSGTSAISSVPASDPIRPNAGNLQRSQTWSGNQMQHAASDAIMPRVEGPVRARSRGGGSGVRRKQAIQSKLATSIASGEMPPFCENCGAIETPTWRKAWTKVHSGTPDHVVISGEEGGVILWEPLQKDENGAINLFRIFKKSLKDTDEGFREILLCNPCGLWLHNRRCMRPKDVYEKTQKRQDEKRNGGCIKRIYHAV